LDLGSCWRADCYKARFRVCWCLYGWRLHLCWWGKWAPPFLSGMDCNFSFVTQHAFSIEFYLESMSFLGRCKTFVGYYNPLCKWLTEMYYFLLQIFIANRDIDRLSDNQLTKSRWLRTNIVYMHDIYLHGVLWCSSWSRALIWFASS
jgi:hypothetical protein